MDILLGWRISIKNSKPNVEICPRTWKRSTWSIAMVLYSNWSFTLSCDSSNSVLFSILFPFTIIHHKERNSKTTGKWTNQMPFQALHQWRSVTYIYLSSSWITVVHLLVITELCSVCYYINNHKYSTLCYRKDPAYVTSTFKNPIPLKTDDLAWPKSGQVTVNI